MLCFDLHIHSALSACAENTMSPKTICTRAAEKKLDVFAITDHNASGNIKAAWNLAEKFNLKFVPGIEVNSREEVHFLALFKNLNDIFSFQNLINHHLPKKKNIPDIFGYQLIFDENDEIIDIDENLRQCSVNLGLDELVQETKRLGGAAIPAHIRKKRFSLLRQLGFVDKNSQFDALELSRKNWNNINKLDKLDSKGFPLLCGSDAHFTEDVGRVKMPLDFKKYSFMKKLLNKD